MPLRAWPSAGGGARLVHQQRPRPWVGQHLHGEPREPGGGAERGQVIGARAHQAADPVPQVAGPSGLGRHPGADPLDVVRVLADDRLDQAGLGAEVISDRGGVSLACGFADLPGGDGGYTVLGEQALRSGHEQLACSLHLLGPQHHHGITALREAPEAGQRYGGRDRFRCRVKSTPPHNHKSSN